MTLRTRTLAIITATLALLLVVLYAVSTRILVRSYDAMENQEAVHHLARVDVSLANTYETLRTAAAAWGEWDDAWNYVRAPYKAYESNHEDSALASLHSEVIIYAGTDGHIVYATGYDTERQKKEPLPPDVDAFFSTPNFFLAPGDLIAIRKGLVVFRDGPMLVLSHPVVRTNGAGPPTGRFLIARRLDGPLSGRIANLAQVNMEILRLDLGGLPQDCMDARRVLASGKLHAVRALDHQTLGAYTVLRDYRNQPALLVRVRLDRTIQRNGDLSRRYLLLATAFACLVFTIVTVLLVEHLILRRLMWLNNDVRHVSETHDVTERVSLEGDDEITEVAAGINKMLAALEGAHRALHESKELFRGIALNASDMLYTIHAETLDVEWYGDVHKALGCSSNSHPNTRAAWVSALHPEDRDAVQAAFRTSCETGSAFSIEYRMRRADGTYAYWTDRGTPVYHEGGGLVKFIGACSDVTDQRLAEAHVRESEERLSRIVETNADGIVIVDLEGQFTFANAAAERIFGMSRAEIVSRTYNDDAWQLADLNGQPLEDDAIAFLRVVSERQPVHGMECSMLASDGRRLALCMNAAPLMGDDGSVMGVVASISDVTERKTLEERLAYQAFHDPLTGLSNRTRFLDSLGKAMQRAAQEHHPLAILFLDLDNFKLINDSLGHAAGDQLLVGVADRIRHCLRSSDLAARLGGDEFTVLVENVHREGDPVQVAERIRDELAKPFLLGTREVFVTASIGIAHSAGTDMEPGDMLRNADAAMYEAKRNGKSRYEIFQVRMNSHAVQRLQLENDLRRAVEREELVVYYQPQMRLSDKRLVGLEALVRWNHPSHGVIAPLDFIPVAEETGLIVPIGRWVLADACRQMKAWEREGAADDNVVVSVNISARQVQTPDFVDDVASILRETGLAPARLALEITETAIVNEGRASLDVLSGLRDLGVALMIDDFGTGYSSLSYLKRFPLDALKIDRSFIQGLGRDHNDSLIVSSTISLAHALNLSVVAEGVETPAQAVELGHLGCDVAQGYCYSAPVPADIIRRDWLRPASAPRNCLDV